MAAKGQAHSGKKTQYACGEDVPAARVQPDYAFSSRLLYFLPSCTLLP